MAKQDMIEVCRDGEYKLLEFTPTLLKPLYVYFEPMSIVRRIRFFMEYLGKGHYRVFYLEKNGELLGHCVVAPGGRRLNCSSDEDIVIGPYYIKESERGRGYSVRLIRLVLDNAKFRYAFDWVEKTNTASCRASEACGFVKYGELNVTPYLRRLIIVENGGEDNIYRYDNSENITV
jgi:RimJ/RimL family protein N-acetyltransferase